MAILMVVIAIFAILEFRTAEAQTVSGCAQCASNAYCYSTYNGNYCLCRRGYHGDGYTGSGNSGCRRSKLRVWKVVVSIIGAIIGALLLLCLCLACIRRCLTSRRRSANSDPAYGYPQQAPYNQQGVPMAMYENNNNQKVPQPAGVV
jgi:hypothetical protein